MSQHHELEKVRDLVKGIRIAMLTHVTPDGELYSEPMATQDVEFDGTIYFIGSRETDQVKAMEANPNVNVAYAGSGAWVSVSGKARIIHDEVRLNDMWSSFTEAWLPGGPEDPNTVLIEVAGTSAAYIDAPGDSKVANLINLVKTKITGKKIEGETGEVDL